MTDKKKASRRDVAKAAGVSVTAVTHALNGTPGMRMSEDTRNRIKRVAAKMDYRPSFIGRALASGKTYTLGLMQPERSIWETNDFYQEIISAFIREIDNDDYNLMLLFRSADCKYMRVIEQGRIDGMIVLQSDLERTHIEKIVESGMPTVVVNADYDPAGKKRVACVRSDLENFVKDILNEFSDAGCGNICTVINPGTYTNNTIITEMTLRSSEMPREMYITNIAPLWQNTQEQFHKILASSNRWDGYYINFIEHSRVFIQEAEKVGLLEGRDFKLITGDSRRVLIGRSDIPGSVYFQDIEGIARETWKILRGMISGGEYENYLKLPYMAENRKDC